MKYGFDFNRMMVVIVEDLNVVYCFGMGEMVFDFIERLDVFLDVFCRYIELGCYCNGCCGVGNVV